MCKFSSVARSDGSASKCVLPAQEDAFCPDIWGISLRVAPKDPTWCNAQLALFLQLVSNAEHWARRTADNSVRVRSQPAQLFLQDAATDYHQVGRVTTSFL
jgi:hypothetical protein